MGLFFFFGLFYLLWKQSFKCNHVRSSEGKSLFLGTDNSSWRGFKPHSAFFFQGHNPQRSETCGLNQVTTLQSFSKASFQELWMSRPRHYTPQVHANIGLTSLKIYKQMDESWKEIIRGHPSFRHRKKLMISCACTVKTLIFLSHHALSQ